MRSGASPLFGSGRGMGQRFGVTFHPCRWRLVEPNETTPRGAVVIGENKDEKQRA